MNRNVKLPDHLGMSSRQFKARKRREFNAALKAMHELMIAAAYMPDGRETGFHIGSTYSDMRKAKKELQKWWRKA